MSEAEPQLPLDEWVTVTWDEYLQVTANSQLEKAKCYYHNGQLRIEMTPQGYDRSADNFSIGAALALLSGFKRIPMSGVTHCTFRKAGEREAQPDLAFYIGDTAEVIPSATPLVDLNIYPPPDLVVEIAKTSLLDNLGAKRLLYERLGVSEYWIVDVRQAQLIAFALLPPDLQNRGDDRGSKPINQSEVLPMLSFSLLEEALQRSRAVGRSQLYAWLLTQIQALEA